jgi:hypothetical protein
MTTVLVYDELRNALHEAITRALQGRPCPDDEREAIYSDLLAYYYKHGVIPDFSLVEKEPKP